MKFGKHAVIGLALDMFDWILIGMIPGIGDIVDVIAIVFWTSKLGPAGLIEAVELIPVVDFLPVNAALGMMVDAHAAGSQPS